MFSECKAPRNLQRYVLYYGGPVGRAREQCTQILETVDAAQPNNRRSARARNDVVRSAVLRSAVVRKCGVQYYGVQ